MNPCLSITLGILQQLNRYSKKKSGRTSLEKEDKDLQFWYSVSVNRDPSHKQTGFTLRSERKNQTRRFCGGDGELKAKKRGVMANKVSNLSDLIQRVAASCLLNPLAAGRQESSGVAGNHALNSDNEEEEEVDEGQEKVGPWEEREKMSKGEEVSVRRMMEMVVVMEEVFEAVGAMKRAYMRWQDAHCPWDPERIRLADVAVVAELRRITVLRERFKRTCGFAYGRNSGGSCRAGGMLRELVAPYEAALEELKREVKTKEAEIENLKEKLRTMTTISNGGGGGKKGKPLSKKKVNCRQVAAAPAPELFEAMMNQVKEASKSFTTLLLSLMRAAHWDIAAAVRSIEAATAATDISDNTTAIPSALATQHAKYALESYLSRKIFQGFDHETFYMDGSLSSLLNPGQFRQDCFTQFWDMKAMAPVELLGILPTCHFGRFCSKKYLSIVHPKMEESLFGDLEQRSQVLAGNHPRSQFYCEFLELAKAVWLLHLLAFSLDPAPCQFEASRGAEFHPQYMESVIRFSGRVPAGQIVGFPVSPGFKLGNGSVIKARVYLVGRT